ncbi:MAG TPA: NAD-dependent epimerase/dehydratase family protein, partial [Thermomicrobiales bacterium]|nr:NAD-dependent epimerase/dehydratase family protein [Thermomicrobiales bacterium]
MYILVTGAAGFIGSFVARRLLADGHRVHGIDDLNGYYQTSLKEARLATLHDRPGFTFQQLAVHDRDGMRALFAGERFDRVVHLAAQAGVRYSIENPEAYVDSNVVGFLTILEGCRAQQTPHLVYASTSSVYGANTVQPFAPEHDVDHPVSLYAATKRANELMAHTYSHIFGLPTTGLRFFTVYGPWGRPDMAAWLFTKAILAGEPINVYNGGRMRRDFTYVEDVAEAVARIMQVIPQPNPDWDSAIADPSSSSAPFRIFNVGNSQPVELDHFIQVLEGLLDKPAIRNDLPMQAGDVLETSADTSALEQAIGWRPSTELE